MTKITADHLGRSAFVYIRQSTADQLLHNPESRRRQYGLADRARQLGEPSLMMPGIIISCIFSEQGRLVLRATPLQS